MCFSSLVQATVGKSLQSPIARPQKPRPLALPIFQLRGCRGAGTVTSLVGLVVVSTGRQQRSALTKMTVCPCSPRDPLPVQEGLAHCPHSGASRDSAEAESLASPGSLFGWLGWRRADCACWGRAGEGEPPPTPFHPHGPWPHGPCGADASLHRQATGGGCHSCSRLGGGRWGPGLLSCWGAPKTELVHV